MARSLAPDRPRAGDRGRGAVSLTVPGAVGQLAGHRPRRRRRPRSSAARAPPGRAGHLACPVSPSGRGAACAGRLRPAPRRPARSPPAGRPRPSALFDAFYRSGALVFGGGHVVLPLLQAEVVAPGWVGSGTVPRRLRRRPGRARPALHLRGLSRGGAGPAPHGVVGAGHRARGDLPAGVAAGLRRAALLGRAAAAPAGPGGDARAPTRPWSASCGSALYDPVWTSAVGTARDFAVAVLAFVLLTVGRVAAVDRRRAHGPGRRRPDPALTGEGHPLRPAAPAAVQAGFTSGGCRPPQPLGPGEGRGLPRREGRPLSPTRGAVAVGSLARRHLVERPAPPLARRGAGIAARRRRAVDPRLAAAGPFRP